MLLAGTLARSPQSGDGGEIVIAALRGGVLHPPGFPLQAWLDRALVQLPGGEPALAIALLGLLAHAGACGLIAETLRLLGVGVAGQVLGAAAFALYTPMWSLAVQPEVFSLAHLLMAATLWASVRVRMAATHPAPPRALAGLGLLGALGAAQHPIALAAFPALIAGVARGLRGAPRRGTRVVVFAAALVLPATALYLSLPLLRTSSLWPDWGALRTPADVVRHVLREDYGTFALSASTGSNMESGLAVWIEDVAREWHVVLLLAAAGLVALVRRRELRPALAPIAWTAMAGAVLLFVSRVPELSYSREVLEHLQGPMALSGALLIGLGTQAVQSFRATTAWRRGVAAGVALVSIAWLVLGWPVADTSHDQTLTLFTRGVGLELSDDMVYVTEGDAEAFMGASAAGGIRYPVSQPLASLSWYASYTAPRLEPRVLQNREAVDDWTRFLGACFSRGLAVGCTSPSLVETPAGTPELRGLLYVARPGATEELTRFTVAGAVDLAPLAVQLPSLPGRGHAFSRFYVRRFARAYAGAGEALRRMGATEIAAQADSIADALNRGSPRAVRSELLTRFVADCRARGF